MRSKSLSTLVSFLKRKHVGNVSGLDEISGVYGGQWSPMPPKGTHKQGHTKGGPKQVKVGEAHKWKKGMC
jgi:hypothetical protein